MKRINNNDNNNHNNNRVYQILPENQNLETF